MRRWKPIAIVLIVMPALYLMDLKIKSVLWQNRLDSGLQALAERRFPEARTQLEAVVARARSFGARDPRLTRSLVAMGYLDVARAKDESAERLFREALSLLENRAQDETADIADALSGLAVAAGHRARDAEAKALLERALAIRQKILGPEHPDVARSLNDLAWIACNEGQYPEAERLGREALAIREKTLDPQDLDIGRNLNDLAWFSIRRCEYDTAKPLLERAKAMFEAAGDPALLDLASCLNRKGILDNAVFIDEPGDTSFLKALFIRERILGSDHPDAAEVVSNLATAWRDQGKLASARKFYERAVRSFEKTMGPDSPGLAWTLTNFARLALEEGKDDEAESLVRRALSIRERAFGASHIEVALGRSLLAEVEFKKGRYAEAESLARRALGILEGTDQRVAQARCLDTLGRTATQQAKYREAEILFKQSLERLYRTLPYPHPEQFRVCHHVAELFHRSGREAQAQGIELSIRFVNRCGTVRPKGPLPIDWSN